ncbi:MAG: NADH-quinone oxidoreductase subunit NuoI [Desulfobulbus sp.]|nr:MAG: NADH-quinone oxidoreductase subunit NuoI [Desulfobulbus sp.]RUM35796.1 MAG: NADH-quinone oxidoreductase subunit NuoI [Desulfobulbus sp.]RUM39475.1 MAG: NADH-quinone oxidoreductase subunit NuoI [Desulfobulbus sp.]
MQIQYKPKRNLLQTILHVEIVQGMALTLRKLFSKPITRQYPQERPDVQLGFRGQHALVRDEETGQSKCVACMRCVTVCPSRCIKITFHDDEESGARVVDTYDIEALRCVYCGFCEEVCPVNAVTLTEVFEYSGFERDEIFFNQETLLSNWDRFAEEKGGDMSSYVNPFWRPRGMSKGNLTAAKRVNVPDEWTIEGQVVGKKFKTKGTE